MDISRAYQEIKSLPDEALTRELQKPSGMVPGYLVMAELEDRKAIRSTSAQSGAKTSMKDELLKGIGSVGYAAGGLVSQTNPFYYSMMARMNPEVAASQMQEKMMQSNGGYYPAQAPGVPMAPQVPGGLSSLIPGAPSPAGSLQEQRYAKGGVVEEPEEAIPQGQGLGTSGNSISYTTIASKFAPQSQGDNTEEILPAAQGPIEPGLQPNGGITPGPIPLPVGYEPSPLAAYLYRSRR